MAKDKERSLMSRIRFFEKMVYHPNWIESMAGGNENRCIELLDMLGYKVGIDYVRQYPIGERFVIDFAFKNEQVAIEIDGIGHNAKKQRKLDDSRDRYLYSVGWVSLRIKDKWLFGSKASFFKNLIREVVEERRKNYQEGDLHHYEIERFNEQDYE